MTPGFQGHDIADAFGRGWSLKVVHPYSCSFVLIRVHWWFVFKNDRLFLPRMIRPVVGGGGPACLKQRLVPGGGKPVQSQTWVVGLFTWMHRMHRIIGREFPPS